MDKFAENIYRLCEEAQPYTYVLAIVSFLVIGAMFLIPSEEGREAPFSLSACPLHLE